MPDPKRQTISASQVSGLWNQHPYVTRWMLYHWIASGLSLDIEADQRMDWGKRLEPAIMAAVADELKLTVTPNSRYIRSSELSPRLGATRDADCIHPEWGLGAVEVKNVDWFRWRDTWTEDAAPPHIEAQLQCQMFVGNGDGYSFQWGVIAALVGGNDLKLYMREINTELQAAMHEASLQLYADVEAGNEPDAFGSEREIPGIQFLYPEAVAGKTVQLDAAFEEIVDEYEHWREQESIAKKHHAAFKAKLLGAAKDAETALALTHEVWITKTDVPESVSTRKAHTRTNIKVRDV